MLTFRGKSRIFNIPVEIGTHYHKFGTLLLNDSTGTLVPQIAAEFREYARVSVCVYICACLLDVCIDGNFFGII